MRIGSLFTGYGGLDIAVAKVTGGTVAWHCEIDPSARRVLDHHWPGVPNHGDVCTVDWSRVEPIDWLVGGFPCQKVSVAGQLSGLDPTADEDVLFTPQAPWTGMVSAIAALRPRVVFIENVRGLLSAPVSVVDGRGVGRAFGAVLSDLARCGYDARWGCFRASSVGAPHRRTRVFMLAVRSDAADTGGEAGQLGTGLRADGAGGFGWRRSDHRSVEAAAHPDTTGCRPGCGLPGPARPAVVGGGAPAVADTDWGQYGPAIHRWESVLGRPAPAPTVTGHRGGQQLSPWFVEWMMGLPMGWVTAIPGVEHQAQLRLLGNGVVPQQATAALRMLLAAW